MLSFWMKRIYSGHVLNSYPSRIRGNSTHPVTPLGSGVDVEGGYIAREASGGDGAFVCGLPIPGQEFVEA